VIVSHTGNIEGQPPISSSSIKAYNAKVFIDNGIDETGFADVIAP